MLWSKLRNSQLNGVKFRRQQPIGEYIVDFVSFDKKLIIEIDGGQHNESVVTLRDSKRTLYFENIGYRVIRFWNHDVLVNTEAVFTSIEQYCINSPSP